MPNLFQSSISVIIRFLVFSLYSYFTKQKLYTLNKIYWPLLIVATFSFIVSVVNNYINIINTNQSDISKYYILFSNTNFNF